ncbi:MAG: ArsB/NhaD family transporter [Kofleriaceae bacterium]
MATAIVCLALVVLIGAVVWRPHGMGPTLGAASAVAIALAGPAELADIADALSMQWRAYITLASIMVMTTAAERMGLLVRIAALIEPRTRGPVKNAFRLTFVLSALVATVLSNDAAILLMTPTVIALLRVVYPKRHPLFVAPFAICVFAAAGVAPLVISNPMNLIFAHHVGIGFNEYAVVMIPVALAGGVVTYAVLAWWFRKVLADESPALGRFPPIEERMSRGAWIVLATLGIELALYPVMSYLQVPLWPIALAGGVACLAVSAASGHARSVARGIAWPVFPFLIAVYVLAIALARIGVVEWLHALWTTSEAPIATIGVTTAVGSAVLNNHPMSVLAAVALEGDKSHALAALIGGDLGPRLLPIGSLASLLWFDLLRKHEVQFGVGAFVRVGVVLTIPTLAVCLAVLAGMTHM